MEALLLSRLLKIITLIVFAMIILSKVTPLMVYWGEKEYLHDRIDNLRSFERVKDIFIDNFEIFEIQVDTTSFYEEYWYLYTDWKKLKRVLEKNHLPGKPIVELWSKGLLHRDSGSITIKKDQTILFNIINYPNSNLFFNDIRHFILYSTKENPLEEFDSTEIIKYKKLKKNWFYVIVPYNDL